MWVYLHVTAYPLCFQNCLFLLVLGVIGTSSLCPVHTRRMSATLHLRDAVQKMETMVAKECSHLVQQHSTVQIMENFPFFGLCCAATCPVWAGGYQLQRCLFSSQGDTRGRRSVLRGLPVALGVRGHDTRQDQVYTLCYPSGMDSPCSPGKLLNASPTQIT